MIVLEKYKRFLKLIGMDPLGGLGNIILRCIHWIMMTSINSVLLLFFVLNIRDDMYRAMAAFGLFLGTTALTVTYLNLVIHRGGFYSLLADLEEIVLERAKKMQNHVIYEKADQRISFTIKFMYVSVLSILTFASVSPFLLVAYHWCLGKYTIDSWFFFYPVWSLFELNTSRCALLVLYETSILTSAALLFCTVPCLLIAFMIYLEACILDIKTILAQVDRLSKCKKPAPPKQKKRDLPSRKKSKLWWRVKSELMMLERLKEAVDLHRKMIRIMHSLAEVLSFTILIIVVPYAICACMSLFLLVKYEGTQFFDQMHQPILSGAVVLNALAIFFYLGQRIHSDLLELSDKIYQTEWYQYPRSARRFVLLMIMRSQQPFHLSAYGVTKLKLGNFVELLNRMYSAFMLLRSID